MASPVFDPNKALGKTAAYQASLSIANSQSLFKLMYIELVMPPNHLILCRPLRSQELKHVIGNGVTWLHKRGAPTDPPK